MRGLVDEAALVARPQKRYALRVPRSSCLLPQAVAARSHDSGCLWSSMYRVIRDDCYAAALQAARSLQPKCARELGGLAIMDFYAPMRGV